jgi:hypothetical protein
LAAASVTPASACNARSTRPVQAPQCIPSTMKLVLAMALSFALQLRRRAARSSVETFENLNL